MKLCLTHTLQVTPRLDAMVKGPRSLQVTPRLDALVERPRCLQVTPLLDAIVDIPFARSSDIKFGTLGLILSLRRVSRFWPKFVANDRQTRHSRGPARSLGYA